MGACASTARVTLPDQRLGLNVHMYDGVGPVASETWSFGAWRLYFLRLDRGQEWSLDDPGQGGATYVKVVTGSLAVPFRLPFIAPRSLADTSVENGRIVAGDDGALVTVLIKTPAAPRRVTAMSQLEFGGPHADRLAWSSFAERFAGLTSAFDGLDGHLAPGFHLLDVDGNEISYVYVWTAGKGVDLTTHNHGRAPSPRSPAFAEVHWVVSNGTGVGGMYETPEPGATHRDRLVVPEGYEHGPFFEFNENGSPVLRDNGAVTYPWHGWQGGDDGQPGQAYDVVIPFETTVPFARVTTS